MAALLYYSCNPWIKWFINREYFGDRHYVWCSPVYDPRRQALDDRGSLIPPTSSPQAIADDLAQAIVRGDQHNAKIVDQKTKIAAFVEKQRAAAVISDHDANDVLYMLRSRDLKFFRPVLYLIPAAGIAPARVESVKPEDRAGFGPEYVIKDLHGSEFDRIETHGNL